MVARVKGPTDHVVVVGAGLAGLSAAMRLAGAGRKGSGIRLPNADEVRFLIVDEDNSPSRLSPEEYGTPGSPLLIDNKGLLFGCQERLCSVSSYISTPKLSNGAILNNVKDSAIVTVNKVRYAVTSISKKLVLVKL